MMTLPLSRVLITEFQSVRRASGSMPVDGSSKKTTDDFPIMATAVLSLRLFPPLQSQEGREKDVEAQTALQYSNLGGNTSH